MCFHKSYVGIDSVLLGLCITNDYRFLIRSKDPREKTNLVVAPLALLQQWYNEIEDKCKDRQFKCLIYHGTSKSNFLKQCVAKRRTAEQGFQKYDVVITTYSTLSLEWPDEEMQLKKAKKARAAERKKAGEAAGDPDEEDPEFRPSAEGGLFKMSWYRIILDEAQGIRNRSTRISRAVAQLDSTFRWCMTGTPITNSLGDGESLSYSDLEIFESELINHFDPKI